MKQVRADDLNYAVLEQVNDVLRCRARFFDAEEADWYARNIYKAAYEREAHAVFRIIDIKLKRETTAFGTVAELDEKDIKLACTMVAA